MKNILLIAIVCLFSIGCNNKQNGKNVEVREDMERIQYNSIWSFYSYIFKSKALFDQNGVIIRFRPVECDIKIKDVVAQKDTLIYIFELEKNGYSYKKVYEGLPVNGIKYFDSTYVPLTGMIKLDNFEKPGFVKEDNLKTDLEFRTYLKNNDTTKISKWLLIEGRKRRVW